MTQRAILILCTVIAIALMPILGIVLAEEEAAPASHFDVIAAAANEYLNDADTVFNTGSEALLLGMLGDEAPYVISVRKYEDYLVGHIPGAVIMGGSTLFQSGNLATLPEDNLIVPYCYTGHTGSQVTALLGMCGYDVSNLTWGIMGWTKNTSVANKQFSNPTTDLPTETTVNEPTMTYALPAGHLTNATEESEIIRQACDAYASEGWKNTNAAALYELITDNDSDNDPVILSVRSADDYAKGHIPGAINIPFKSLATTANLQKLDPDKQIVVYCYTGRSGSQATAILNVLGYDATNLLWGISGWTTDSEVAAKRFNPDTSVDYPFQSGEGDAPVAPPADGGGGCGG